MPSPGTSPRCRRAESRAASERRFAWCSANNAHTAREEETAEEAEEAEAEATEAEEAEAEVAEEEAEAGTGEEMAEEEEEEGEVAGEEEEEEERGKGRLSSECSVLAKESGSAANRARVSPRKRNT